MPYRTPHDLAPANPSDLILCHSFPHLLCCNMLGLFWFFECAKGVHSAALACAVTFYRWLFSHYPSSSLWWMAYSFLKLRMSPPEMSFLTLPSKLRHLSFCLKALCSFPSQLLSKFKLCVYAFSYILPFQVDCRLHADRTSSILSGSKYVILLREICLFCFLRWLKYAWFQGLPWPCSVFINTWGRF